MASLIKKDMRILLVFLSLFIVTLSAHAVPLRNDTRLIEAEQLIQTGKDQVARVLLDEMLAADVRNIDAYVLRAHLHAKDEDFDEARRDLRKATTLNPRHLGAHLTIGRIYIQLEQKQKAREQLQALRLLCTEICKEYQTLKTEIDAE